MTIYLFLMAMVFIGAIWYIVMGIINPNFSISRVYPPLDDVANSNWSEDRRRIVWIVILSLWSLMGTLAVSLAWPIGVLTAVAIYIGGKRKESNVRYAAKNIFPDSPEKQHKAIRNLWLAMLAFTLWGLCAQSPWLLMLLVLPFT
ncbi:MAG: hypothetical protein ACE5FZ_06635 [Nitrospiria bacterium]